MTEERAAWRRRRAVPGDRFWRPFEVDSGSAEDDHLCPQAKTHSELKGEDFPRQNNVTEDDSLCLKAGISGGGDGSSSTSMRLCRRPAPRARGG